MRKIKKLILLGLFLYVSLGASAYDFESGGIYYNITSSTDLTCGVTYEKYEDHTHISDYKGIVNIPASVTYNSKTYSVTSIGNGTFANCSGLTSVTIPNSVTSIGYQAFWGCSGLTSINIPNSVTSIGNYAFSGCSGLTSITIPNSVTSIGKWAFDGCSGLTSINIPNSVTSIVEGAFYDCSGLTSIEIPNSVTSIGYQAFRNCSGLTFINIPNSVTSIGDGTFCDCSGLTSVTIGNSVTSIGKYAFRGCTSLPIENNLRYADTYLVGAVDKTLSTYTIKEGTKWIGYQAFWGCSGLTSINIPNSVTSIGSGSFDGCSGLTSIEIPNSVTSIGGYSFYKCSGLTSIEIPNSVTSIGSSAFSGCSGLTSINIPNSVTSIESEVFQGCNMLENITVNWEKPISIVENVFSNYNATLYVPIKSITTYKSADVWKKFSNITGYTIYSQLISNTQTTITLKVTDNSDKSISYEEIGVKWSSKYYKANTEGIVKIEHLCPNTSGIVYGYAKYGGEYYVSELGTSVSTKPINSEIAFSDIMANKAFVRGVYDIGDAHVYKTTFELKIPTEKGSSWTGEEIEYKNDKFTLMGLEPDTEYGVCYTVYYHYGENDEYSGSEYDKQYFTTAKLKMKTLNPKNVSSTSSVVAAEANISDDETGAGFEWRKYDAPESLPSSKGGAIVYDGRMEGKINNLQATYYSVRPYYESASGKVFYGEWITFDPTDFSYFEPTVHTYDFPEAPSTNSVEVRGYVMQGTDDVTEQGFEYWKTGGSSQRKMASNGEVMRVQATGQKMIAMLRDLDYESNYVVRAYVVTASGTVYGEERMFTTPADPTSGISEVKESESVSRSLKGIYTLDGRKIERITTPGIYLYNGKKIMFKAGQLPVE